MSIKHIANFKIKLLLHSNYMLRAYLLKKYSKEIIYKNKEIKVISGDREELFKSYCDHIESVFNDETLMIEDIISYFGIPSEEYIISRNIFEDLYCSRDFNSRIDYINFKNIGLEICVDRKFALLNYDVIEHAVDKMLSDLFAEKTNRKKGYKYLTSEYNERIIGLYLWDRKYIEKYIDSDDASKKFIEQYGDKYLYQYRLGTSEKDKSFARILDRKCDDTDDIIRSYAEDKNKFCQFKIGLRFKRRMLLLFNVCLRAFSEKYKISLDMAYDVFVEELGRRVAKDDFKIIDLCCYFSVVDKEYINSDVLLTSLLNDELEKKLLNKNIFIRAPQFVMKTRIRGIDIINRFLCKFINDNIRTLSKISRTKNTRRNVVYGWMFNNHNTVACMKIYDYCHGANKISEEKAIEKYISDHSDANKCEYVFDFFPGITEKINDRVIGCDDIYKYIKNRYRKFKKYFKFVTRCICVNGAIEKTISDNVTEIDNSKVIS